MLKQLSQGPCIPSVSQIDDVALADGGREGEMRGNEKSRTRATSPRHEMVGMAIQGCPKRYPSEGAGNHRRGAHTLAQSRC